MNAEIVFFDIDGTLLDEKNKYLVRRKKLFAHFKPRG